jgi:hypothetical protein
MRLSRIITRIFRNFKSLDVLVAFIQHVDQVSTISLILRHFGKPQSQRYPQKCRWNRKGPNTGWFLHLEADVPRTVLGLE